MKNFIAEHIRIGRIIDTAKIEITDEETDRAIEIFKYADKLIAAKAMALRKADDLFRTTKFDWIDIREKHNVNTNKASR